jgi:hypothetical protein
VPDKAKRRGGTPAADQAVVERIAVPAEVATRTVDGLADGAVEALDVGNVATVEVVRATGSGSLIAELRVTSTRPAANAEGLTAATNPWISTPTIGAAAPSSATL